MLRGALKQNLPSCRRQLFCIQGMGQDLGSIDSHPGYSFCFMPHSAPIVTITSLLQSPQDFPQASALMWLSTRACFLSQDSICRFHGHQVYVCLFRICFPAAKLKASWGQGPCSAHWAGPESGMLPFSEGLTTPSSCGTLYTDFSPFHSLQALPSDPFLLVSKIILKTLSPKIKHIHLLLVSFLNLILFSFLTLRNSLRMRKSGSETKLPRFKFN